MKKRILSVVLALCLCGSSPAMAYASQEISLQSEEAFVEKSTDEESTVPAEEAPQPEDIPTEENTKEPDGNSDVVTDPEEPSHPEEPSTEGSTEEMENTSGTVTDSEEPSQTEDISTEESTEDPENSGDTVTDLEEATEDLDNSSDVETDSGESTEGPENSSDAETDSEESTEEMSEDANSSLQEEPLQPEDILTEESTEELTDLAEVLLLSDELLVEEGEPAVHDDTVPTFKEAYSAMIALRDQDAYKEGATWTNNTPSEPYRWKGGKLGGTSNIIATGCAAFAFILSDTAFGYLPARMYSPGEFQYNAIKVGDILRLNTDTHTVIVLEVSETGVVIAEGNYSGKVHWGRAMSKEEVMLNVSHYITRYPEGYVAPDDSEADISIGSGSLDDSGLTWNLTQAGTLTISGNGAMPDYGPAIQQPWNENSSQIKKVVIENGVTSIGQCAFQSCGLLSVSIPDSVTTIGHHAFRDSSIISVTIPNSVTTIGDSAFRSCKSLAVVAFSEGARLKTIEQNAFGSCTSLGSIELPASIEEVGEAAFASCEKMTDVTFAPGNKQVELGNNLFTECWWLMRVTLPKSIDCIGQGMFYGCKVFPGVEIPQGVTDIGMQAFASSGTKVLIIPDSVTYIAPAALSGCPLTDIYYTGSAEEWGQIRKGSDVDTVVANVTMHYDYSPATDPAPLPGGDDTLWEDDEEPSTPDEGDDTEEPSIPDEGDDSDNPSTPDEGDDNEDTSAPDNGNGSNKPNEGDSNNSNENDSDNSSNREDNSASAATTVRPNTAPVSAEPVSVEMIPVETIIPAEEISLKEGYTAAQANVSKASKLGADLLQAYAGQKMYLNAVFAADFGLTIDMAGVPTVSKDLEIRYTLAEEPMPAPEFDVIHAIPNEIIPLGFDAVFNFYVGDEHIGKKAYIYVLNATRTGYDLIGAAFVNAIGNIAFHSEVVTDVIIFIEK